MARSLAARTGSRKSGPVARAMAQQPDPSNDAASAESGLGPDLQAHLGEQLRAFYREVVTEPVPRRFLELLEELARKGRAGDE